MSKRAPTGPQPPTPRPLKATECQTKPSRLETVLASGVKHHASTSINASSKEDGPIPRASQQEMRCIDKVREEVKRKMDNAPKFTDYTDMSETKLSKLLMDDFKRTETTAHYLNRFFGMYQYTLDSGVGATATVIVSAFEITISVESSDYFYPFAVPIEGELKGASIDTNTSYAEYLKTISNTMSAAVASFYDQYRTKKAEYDAVAAEKEAKREARNQPVLDLRALVKDA